MDIPAIVEARGGIVHRQELLDLGASPQALRRAVNDGAVTRIRRSWIAGPTAPAQLRAAAGASGRLACVSAARHRGWWMPPGLDPSTLHLHLHPHARMPAPGAVLHWSVPLVPVGRQALIESVIDTLEHIAVCQIREDALIVWESAAQHERLAVETLRRVGWRSRRAAALAEDVSGRMDSGLETIFASRLRRRGIDVRVQVKIAGHEVDALIGERLIAQLDGFAFHSSSAERTRDTRHDRELIARGYTVLRFTYADVVHGWPEVERAIALAVAQGLHRAA